MILRALNSIIFFLLFTCLSQAQYDLIHLNQFDDYSSAHLNPSYIPDSNFVLVLPGIALNFAQKGPTLEKIIRQNSSGNNFVDTDALTNNLEPINSIRGGFEYDIASVFLKVSDWCISGSYRWKFDGLLNYNESLAKLYANGNAQFIGETVEVGPEFLLNAYHDFSFGIAKDIGKLDFGVKAHVISGVENIHSEKSNIDLYTSDDIYQLTIGTDLLINSSRLIDYNDIDDIEFNSRGYSYKGFFSGNIGFSLDVGLGIDLTDKVRVQASALDIGSINWDTRVTNLSSQESITYEGIDLNEYIGDTTSIAFEDSLRSLLEIAEANESYSLALPGKYILGMSYDLNKSLRIGAIAFYEAHPLQNRLALALNGYKSIGALQVGAQYAYTEESAFNLGLSLGANISMFRIRFNTDNVIGVFNPDASPFTNMRISLAMIL